MEELKDEKRTCLPIYFFLIGVLLRYMAGCYLKNPTIYWDELKYYGLARSIYHGFGLTVCNTPTNFQKILYALVLSPLFAVRNVEIRIRLIALLNSLLMNSCVFPLWKICSKLQVEKRRQIVLAAFLILWPDMVMTETFMSENLYWPLFFWYITLHFCREEQSYWLRGLAEGVLIYAGYLCKEVFAAVLAADAISLALEGKLCPREKEERQREWCRFLLAAIVFGILFNLGKLLFFRGLGQGYNQYGPAALAQHSGPLYFVSAVLFFIASTLLAVQLLPLVIPLLRFRRMKREQQRFFLFIGVFILCVICGIAYAISIREDLGSLTPRNHLRYYAPAVFLLLPVLAVCPDDSEPVSREKELSILLICAIMVLLLFRTTANSFIIDQMTLQWLSGLNLLLYNAFGAESVLFWGFQVAAITLGLAVSVGIYALFTARKKDFLRPFFIFLLIPVLCSGYFGHAILKSYYTKYLAPFESVGRLSDHFEQTEDKVLYLTDTYPQFRHSKAWNCRYEPVERSYYLILSGYYEHSGHTGTAENSAGSDAPGTRVEDIEFSAYIDEGYYSSTDRIDYIVIPSETALAPENDEYLEYVPALSDEYHSVYRNRDPETLYLDNIHKENDD